ncbi:RNA-directed DNA polymerase, eukaryota, reverse transcriptase zinc-binding domain protein [Tanacetum coccineum]
MMNEPWGRNSYARAMIEIDAESELKESCKTFCHSPDSCPLAMKDAPKRKSVHVQDDGFEVVKGKNKGKKQVERNFVSHVDIGKLEKVCAKWKWTSNAIHTQVFLKSDSKVLFCNLFMHQIHVNLAVNCGKVSICISTSCKEGHGLLWVTLIPLFLLKIRPKDINVSMQDFNACVTNIEVEDVNSTGLNFTWNQKPKGGRGILKKIDRVMCNIGFNVEYPGSYAVFQPYGISDHAPAVLKIHGETKAIQLL